jgi:hypothetical protein
MFFTRFLAALDQFPADAFRMHRNGPTPGADGSAESWNYYGMIVPRYVIFGDGQVQSSGGFFETQHRYDNDGRLLSRRRRYKAE